MRPKLDQIITSIEGITTPLQKKLLAQIIDHLVQEYMTEYETAIEAIDEIPGIARRSTEVLWLKLARI